MIGKEMLAALGLYVAILSSGQLLFKKAAQSSGTISGLGDVRLLVTNHWLWMALILYGVATVLWVAILQRVPPRSFIRGAVKTIAPGQRIDPAELIRRLESYGYDRSSTVMEPGEYAQRGGILDPFSGFTCSVSQLHVESRGHVRIKSADANAAPAIRPASIDAPSPTARSACRSRSTRSRPHRAPRRPPAS